MINYKKNENENPNTINKEHKEPIFEINDKDFNLKKLILLQLNQCDFPNEKNKVNERLNKGDLYEKIKNKLKRFSKCNIKVKESELNENIF